MKKPSQSKTSSKQGRAAGVSKIAKRKASKAKHEKDAHNRALHAHKDKMAAYWAGKD